MSGTVKRRYDAATRRRSALARRERVLDAALLLFSEGGYAGTTIASIAKRADVASDTVFAQFGDKAKLLEAAIMRGEREGARIEDSGTPGQHSVDPVGSAVRRHVAIAARVARAAMAVREARGAEPGLRRLLAAGEARRREDAARWVDRLDGLGALRPDLSKRSATEITWLLLSPETYVRLVVERGWPPNRYQAWLTGALRALVLRSPVTAAPRRRKAK